MGFAAYGGELYGFKVSWRMFCAFGVRISAGQGSSREIHCQAHATTTDLSHVSQQEHEETYQSYHDPLQS
jgi:hypothetical protein